MRGLISGYVARVEHKDDRTVLSITGLTGDGRDDEHPFVQNVRFKGAHRELVRSVKVGVCVLVDAALVYEQWAGPDGSPRSQNCAVGFTCTVIDGGVLSTRDGYTCPLFCLNEFTLRVRLVRGVPPAREQRGKRVAEARAVCSDQHGAAHYYTVTAWHRLASSLSRGKQGDTLLLKVKARKEKWRDERGEHWRDNIEVTHLTLAPKALPAQALRTIPLSAPGHLSAAAD